MICSAPYSTKLRRHFLGIRVRLHHASLRTYYTLDPGDQIVFIL